ncbi:MAG: hypothetical protein ACYCPD_00740 [Acidobacteriaceae bacterium]
MSLSIDETKVTELMKSTNKGYIVSTSSIPLAIENSRPCFTTSGISGVVYAAPKFVTAESRSNLISARRRIEESGVPLKSAETLAREIEEMRSRG